jgi:drug/metabolite transporter (DMT)-like permease
MAQSAFFFSLMSVAVKLAGTRLPYQQLVLARGVVTLALSAWGVRKLAAPWGHNKRLLLVRGFVGFCGLNCYYYSLTTLPLADATAIQYMNPVITAVLAGVFLGEGLRGREIVLALLALVGAVLISRPSFLFASLAPPLPTWPLVVAVLGAFASAFAYLLVRTLGKTESPQVVVLYFPLVAVPLTLPEAAGHLLMPTPSEWLILLALGVFTQLGQQRLTVGLSLERAGPATAISYLQIVFAFVWSVALFHERIEWLTLLGSALIVGAALVIARRT